jgi:hypothetical protein
MSIVIAVVILAAENPLDRDSIESFLYYWLLMMVYTLPKEILDWDALTPPPEIEKNRSVTLFWIDRRETS